MSTIASQITCLTIVYSTVYSDTDQKKTSKLCVTGLCVGNSPGTGEFPAQMASNAENVSIWWRHQVGMNFMYYDFTYFSQFGKSPSLSPSRSLIATGDTPKLNQIMIPD